MSAQFFANYGPAHAAIRAVVLSIDYEIYGNGAGDVIRHMIDPMKRMADLADRSRIPLTIFLEAEEYAAFERFAPQLRNNLGYDPAELIRRQIADLTRRGHDVQLHLHPEWVGAQYENGTWQLRSEMNTVDQLFETQDETNRYIASRKLLVEQLAAVGRPGHQVQVYRAGAFSAQPGKKLLHALRDNNIVIDSSVVKGLQHRNGSIYLDYRAAPCAKGPWRVRDDVLKPVPDGPIWEFPIYSKTGRRFQQITFARLRAKFSRNVPAVQQRRLIQQMNFGKNPLSWMRFLWQPVPVKLDFHNMSATALMKWIRTAPVPPTGQPDILVLIGHTKDHASDGEFESFLRKLGDAPDLPVVGFGEIAKRLTSGSN